MKDKHFVITLTDKMIIDAFKDSDVPFTEENFTRLMGVLDEEELEENLTDDLSSWVRVAIRDEWNTWDNEVIEEEEETDEVIE